MDIEHVIVSLILLGAGLVVVRRLKRALGLGAAPARTSVRCAGDCAVCSQKGQNDAKEASGEI